MSLLFLLFFGVFAILTAFLLMNFFIIGATLLLVFGICATIIFNPIYASSGIFIVGSIIGITYINKQLKKDGIQDKKLKMLKQGKMCCRVIIVFTASVLLSYIIYNSVKYVKQYKMAKKYSLNKHNSPANEIISLQVLDNFAPFEEDELFFQPVDIKIKQIKKEHKNIESFPTLNFTKGTSYEYTMHNSQEKLKLSNEYGVIQIITDSHGKKINGKCKNGKEINFNDKGKKFLGQQKLSIMAEKVLSDNCIDHNKQVKNSKQENKKNDKNVAKNNSKKGKKNK